SSSKEGYCLYVFCLLFFFQAEDGIRDGHVTGVQTCALPISWWHEDARAIHLRHLALPLYATTRTVFSSRSLASSAKMPSSRPLRSEERRVGKECRARWSPDDEKKNK